MKLRVLHDLVHLEMEPVEEVKGGIIVVRPPPVRSAIVKAVGPGRRWGRHDTLVKTQVKPGERVYVLAAAVDGHKQGQAIENLLGENEGLIPERDILFVADEGKPEVTL